MAHVFGPLSYTASLSSSIQSSILLGNIGFPPSIIHKLCSIHSTLWVSISQHHFSWGYLPTSFSADTIPHIHFSTNVLQGFSVVFSLIFSVFISQFSLQSQTVSFSVPIHWHTPQNIADYPISQSQFNHSHLLSTPLIGVYLPNIPPRSSLSQCFPLFGSFVHVIALMALGFISSLCGIILGYWHFLPPWSSLVPFIQSKGIHLHSVLFKTFQLSLKMDLPFLHILPLFSCQLPHM